jgi:hypothetical protein
VAAVRASATRLLALILFAAASAARAAAGPEAGVAEGGACVTSFDCTTTAAPTCSGGTCVAGPALCVSDDSADLGLGDDGPAAATALGETPIAAAICNQPATEADFHRFTVTDGSRLDLALAWSGPADLDLRVYDASGRLFGASLHRNPEVVELRVIGIGDYLVEVRRTAASPIAVAVPYTLTATPQFFNIFCKLDTDCQILRTSTALYRSVCLGSFCGFRAATGLGAGALCDSDANCASGRCSYTAYQAAAGASVCTETCVDDTDCGSVPGAPICSFGRAPNICLPGCVADAGCGTDPATKSPDPGEPWDYYACTVAAQRCNAWIFKDGFEGGDDGLW